MYAGRCEVKAKFHYTDTDTDFFAAKRTRTDPTEFRRQKGRVCVRVRVVEFSYYRGEIDNDRDATTMRMDAI